jgi:WD40 repeat protein
LSAGLVGLLVIASIAGVTAVGRQRQATDRARVATAQRLTQQAGSATGLDLRLLLAVEARRLDDSPEARGALLGQLTQANAVTAFLRGGAANLSAVAMSPDGSMLATGGADGAVSLWRLPGDELLRTVPLLDGRVKALVFSADGELAAGGDNGEVARWTLDGSKPTRFRAHASNVLALAYGSGHSLLTAGDDGLLRAFSVSNGQELWSRSIPVGALAATFDANGSTYVQTQPDRSLSVIDVGGGSSVLAGGRDTNDTVSALALSANGRRVAFGTSSGIVKVLDRDSGTTSDLGRISSQTAASSVEGVDALVFTPAGEVLATAGGSITRLNPANSDNREPLQLVGGRVTGLAVDPSGETATAVTETGEAVVFALRRPGLGRPLANAGQPVTALTVAQGQLVAAAGDSQVALWDTASDHRRVLPMPGHPVTAIAASGDGTLLAVVGRDFVLNGIQTSTYAVVDVNSGRLLVEAAWYPNTVAATAVALQPAGTLLAIGDEHGGQVRVFEATTGRPVRDLNSPAAAIAALAFTPSGQELVGVTTDGVVVRWDTQGRPIGQPIELGSNASALAMAPDGNMIAVATASGALIVDLATGAIGAGLTSPFGRIESVAFGLDGTVLATGGSGRVILWDVRSRRPLGNALPAPGNTSVAFDTTGRQLITGGDDGEVIVWPIDPDRWVEMACNLAGRTLTRDEWRRYLGDRTYHPACG